MNIYNTLDAVRQIKLFLTPLLHGSKDLFSRTGTIIEPEYKVMKKSVLYETTYRLSSEQAKEAFLDFLVKNEEYIPLHTDLDDITVFQNHLTYDFRLVISQKS